MVLGNGQLANIFKDIYLIDTIIFASGVSNSNCANINDFNREKELIIQALLKNPNSKFVYFSCTALSATDYYKNAYYKHKYGIENLIKEYTNNFYIFRLPQVFGKLKKHNTLINYLYTSILNDNEFDLYHDAYRYVIDIVDIKKLVIAYLDFSDPNITVDLANPYRYNIFEIVLLLEKILNKKSRFNIITKQDGYHLNLSDMIEFIQEHNIKITLGQDYLEKRLQKHLSLKPYNDLRVC